MMGTACESGSATSFWGCNMSCPEKWAKAQNDAEVLASCSKPHHFQIAPTEIGKYVCTKCGGYVTEEQALWYHLGLRDGLSVPCHKSA